MFGALRDATRRLGRRVIKTGCGRRQATPESSIWTTPDPIVPARSMCASRRPTRRQAVRYRRSSTCAICWMPRRGLRKANRCRHTWGLLRRWSFRWAVRVRGGGDHRRREVDRQVPGRNDPFNVPPRRARHPGAGTQGRAWLLPRMETLADGRQVMLIERFDREPLAGGVGRRHMVSALTLLALHEQDSPDSSYAAIADAMGVHGVKWPDRVRSPRAVCADGVPTFSCPTTTIICATTPSSSMRKAVAGG